MERCVCRKQSFCEYRDDDEELLGVNCTSCGQEWLKETSNPRERIIFQGQEMGKYTHKECVDSGFLMTRPERTKITPRNVSSLRKGDHITWHRSYGIWHHAIVVKTFSSGQIEVCHFASDKTRLKAIIKNKVMDPLKENGNLYRINYSSIPDENSAELVVARTKVLQSMSTIGEYCYNFFRNNCENFATFCKTGFSISYQLEWLKKNAQHAIDLGVDFGKDPSVRRRLYQLRFVLYEGIEALTGAGDVLGAGLLVLGEVFSCYKDIGEINAKEGMTDEDRHFEKHNRLYACAGGMVLGAVGSYALGQYMGSTLGSLIGGPLGLFVGRMIGGWVGGLIASSGNNEYVRY
ncbi:uncharacterized protein LOC128218190 [Mya arenaria]|uniref:uncharacterized protein LOC128218190 n=1 Tax=Mya arenaria TaxID=6604 RepID=UPI0022E5F79F|nr:uncharacterized protein LOC128218190 [Mya arenaria]XP_052781736.1 uncharacterized protein LOC128218190 [Mya arenaria]XP_052781737.1 uncharacterized protein LOC128218190 [Mya arenaria]